MKVIISAAGTAGHINPALAISEKIASSVALINGIGSWIPGIKSVYNLTLYVRRKRALIRRKWRKGLLRRSLNIGKERK